MIKLNWFFVATIVLLVVFGIFALNNYREKSMIRGENTDDLGNDFVAGQKEEWMNTELKDIRTGEFFKISDFQDRPVLLESFAVWCPKCLKQQQEIKELSQKLGDSFIAVSLDTDPNEDEDKVREYIESKGFNWYYAVSPSVMTKALIEEYSTEIVNAPSTPIIIICREEARKLRSGIKSYSELEAEINKCTN